MKQSNRIYSQSRLGSQTSRSGAASMKNLISLKNLQKPIIKSKAGGPKLDMPPRSTRHGIKLYATKKATIQNPEKFNELMAATHAHSQKRVSTIFQEQPISQVIQSSQHKPAAGVDKSEKECKYIPINDQTSSNLSPILKKTLDLETRKPFQETEFNESTVSMSIINALKSNSIVPIQRKVSQLELNKQTVTSLYFQNSFTNQSNQIMIKTLGSSKSARTSQITGSAQQTSSRSHISPVIMRHQNSQSCESMTAFRTYRQPGGGGHKKSRTLSCVPPSATSGNCAGTTKVRVVARFRPFNQEESKQTQLFNAITLDLHDETIVKVQTSQAGPEISPMSFKFDKVFGPVAKQQEMYDFVAPNIVEDALNGFNSTVLAYGQTGSGKTYTMYGRSDSEHQGIIPRVAAQIFIQIQKHKEKEEGENKSEYTINLQMLEIYQESLIDLLQKQPELTGDHLIDDQIIQNKELKIKECVNRGTFIEGLTSAKICSSNDINDLISMGERNRHVNSTKQNKLSSRSHSICQIEIIHQISKDSFRKGLINLVDLAGSERVSKSFAKGAALEEAKKINSSLSTLGKVISSISKNSSHIPYRDSKLTRLLKESLGGNNKTTLIVTGSLHHLQIEETLSTLRFAQSAKLIQNKVKMNFKSNQSLISEQNAILANMVTSLKHELSFAKAEVCKLTNQINDGSTILLNQSQSQTLRHGQPSLANTLSAKSSFFNTNDKICPACGKSCDLGGAQLQEREALELQLHESKIQSFQHLQLFQNERRISTEALSQLKELQQKPGYQVMSQNIKLEKENEILIQKLAKYENKKEAQNEDEVLRAELKSKNKIIEQYIELFNKIDHQKSEDIAKRDKNLQKMKSQLEEIKNMIWQFTKENRARKPNEITEQQNSHLNLQMYIKNVSIPKQRLTARKKPHNKEYANFDPTLTLSMVNENDKVKESGEQKNLGFMSQRNITTRITPLNYKTPGGLMQLFNYETKNLRMRSQQKQQKRHLNCSAGGASRTSKCSDGQMRIQDRGSSGSCENELLFSSAVNYTSNHDKNPKQTPQFTLASGDRARTNQLRLRLPIINSIQTETESPVCNFNKQALNREAETLRHHSLPSLKGQSDFKVSCFKRQKCRSTTLKKKMQKQFVQKTMLLNNRQKEMALERILKLLLNLIKKFKFEIDLNSELQKEIEKNTQIQDLLRQNSNADFLQTNKLIEQLKSYSEKNAQLEREVGKLQTQIEENQANAKISNEGEIYINESRSCQKQFGHQLVQNSVVLSSMPIRNFNQGVNAKKQKQIITKVQKKDNHIRMSEEQLSSASSSAGTRKKLQRRFSIRSGDKPKALHKKHRILENRRSLTPEQLDDMAPTKSKSSSQTSASIANVPYKGTQINSLTKMEKKSGDEKVWEGTPSSETRFVPEMLSSQQLLSFDTSPNPIRGSDLSARNSLNSGRAGTSGASRSSPKRNRFLPSRQLQNTIPVPMIQRCAQVVLEGQKYNHSKIRDDFPDITSAYGKLKFAKGKVEKSNIRM